MSENKTSTTKRATARPKEQAPKKEAAPKAAAPKTLAELKAKYLSDKASNPSEAQAIHAAYVKAKKAL